MVRVARRLVIVAGVVVLLAAAIGGALVWASRQTPDFYRDSLANPVAVDAADGERLEQQALALHNQLQHAGRFEVRFTQDEINAWLANELPAKFPRLLPSMLADPRVAIEKGKMRLAVRYTKGNVETVLSVAGEAHVTGQPNELAVRIGQARAGLVPVPLGKVLEDIQQRPACRPLPRPRRRPPPLPADLRNTPRLEDRRHQNPPRRRLTPRCPQLPRPSEPTRRQAGRNRLRRPRPRPNHVHRLHG